MCVGDFFLIPSKNVSPAVRH